MEGCVRFPYSIVDRHAQGTVFNGGRGCRHSYLPVPTPQCKTFRLPRRAPPAKRLLFLLRPGVRIPHKLALAAPQLYWKLPARAWLHCSHVCGPWLDYGRGGAWNFLLQFPGAAGLVRYRFSTRQGRFSMAMFVVGVGQAEGAQGKLKENTLFAACFAKKNIKINQIEKSPRLTKQQWSKVPILRSEIIYHIIFS